ncbi:unnamed protein product [Dibothriocephalus latus]|uniref:Uncharacterized protein n=1 Tax=Dibothriocephalus latus TaxID=60516 RepID=A0A3P7NP68_DIBLA|nr:unnamed protein product [Dibothriocephalus latus]
MLTPILPPGARQEEAVAFYLKPLGYRDPEETVEAFIKANTKRKKRKVHRVVVCCSGRVLAHYKCDDYCAPRSQLSAQIN